MQTCCLMQVYKAIAALESIPHVLVPMFLVSLAATAFIQHYSASNFFMQLPQPQPQCQPQLLD